MKQHGLSLSLLSVIAFLCVMCSEPEPEPAQGVRVGIGIFDGQTTPSTFQFDTVQQVYQLPAKAAYGTHFLWKRLSGDFALEVQLPDDVDNASFGLMLRAEPDTDMALGTLQITNGQLEFIPAARTSLSTKGGSILHPKYLRLERQGSELYAYYALDEDEPFRLLATQRMSSDSILYGGIVAEVAQKPLTFSKVRITKP